MAIFPGDVIIKSAIEQGLEDIKKNLWLVDDILAPFISQDVLKDKYGQKEIDNAKEWLTNNKIEVLMQYRLDKDEFPCVTVALGSSSELEDMKHLADLSTVVEELIPSQIGKPIPYVIKPFVPASYDQANGLIELPKELSKSSFSEGQILVNPDTGEGYTILGRAPGNKIQIEPNLTLNATRLAVIPKYQTYKVRREHSFFRETYTIGCHTHGDPSTLLWLHAIVAYILLRYRESLLEGRCFTQSSISSSDLVPNAELSTPGGENVYSRYITLSGQVENSWLKSPRRVIETIELTEPNKDEGFYGGIKIISQEAPEFLDNEDEPWTTIDE